MRIHRILAFSIILAIILRSLNFYYVFYNPHLLCGYDTFYHMKRILTIIHGGNIWFDYYINYPHGLKIMWMPLFDCSIAYLSILGNPEVVASAYPVFLSALTVVVVYYIGKRLNENVGILSALTLAVLFAHAWYSRFGFVDHHSTEVLIFSITVLLLLNIDRKFETKFGELVIPIAIGMAVACLYLFWFGSPIYLSIIVLFVILNHFLTKNAKTTSYFLVSLLISLIILLCCFILGIPLLNHILTVLLAIFAVLMLLIRENKLRLVFVLLSVLIVYLNKNFVVAGFNYFFSNVYLKTVSEAKPFGINDIFYFTLVFPFAILGSIFLIKKIIDIKNFMMDHENEGSYVVILLCWFIAASILMLIQGRFIYFASPIFSILSAYFILSFKRKHAIFLALLAIIPNAYITAHFVSKPPDVYGDWYETLTWMSKNTPNTSYYFETKLPEYGVLSWWDYGNWIVYIAKRPVVANNFQTGIADASKFFTETNEDLATKILNKRKIRYVIVDDKMGFDYLLENGDFVGVANGPGSYYQMLNFANRNKSEYYDKINDRLAELKLKYYNSMYARMYLFYGSFTKTPAGNVDALKHFRLIYESNTTVFNISNFGIKKIKVYEYVKGARVFGKSKPNQTVFIAAKVKTKYKTFFYGYSAKADEKGKYVLTLPYSTGRNYDVVVDKYMLKVGEKIYEFSINEENILNGDTLSLDELLR